MLCLPLLLLPCFAYYVIVAVHSSAVYVTSGCTGDFISAGHGQQNGEQLNNLLKTLHGYYFRSGAAVGAGEHIEMANKAEFVSYFVIFQLGNGGEVSKYLQQLPHEILDSAPLRFAIEVWGALKTQNYAKYFRLLRTRATLLQACLMFRYVGTVRLSALRKLTRSMNPPGKAGPGQAPQSQEYRVRDIMSLFMFESIEETLEFVEHCGLEPSASSSSSSSGTSWEDDYDGSGDLVVRFSGQSIDSLMPRDKNDNPILPKTYFMGNAIDHTMSLRPGATDSANQCYSIMEICRGCASPGASPTIKAPKQDTSAPRPVGAGTIGVRAPTSLARGAPAAGVPIVRSGLTSTAPAPSSFQAKPPASAHTLTPNNAPSTSTISFGASATGARAVSGGGDVTTDAEPFTTAAATATTALTTTAAATPSTAPTTIDKNVLKNKMLLMSGGLSSGRGPKAEKAPLPQVDDQSLWSSPFVGAGGQGAGAGTGGASGGSKGKRISPVPLPASTTAGSGGGGAEVSGAWRRGGDSGASDASDKSLGGSGSGSGWVRGFDSSGSDGAKGGFSGTSTNYHERKVSRVATATPYISLS
jgi:hypothetical protein